MHKGELQKMNVDTCRMLFGEYLFGLILQWQVLFDHILKQGTNPVKQKRKELNVNNKHKLTAAVSSYTGLI